MMVDVDDDEVVLSAGDTFLEPLPPLFLNDLPEEGFPFWLSGCWDLLHEIDVLGDVLLMSPPLQLFPPSGVCCFVTMQLRSSRETDRREDPTLVT